MDICHNLNSTNLHDTVAGDVFTILGAILIIAVIFGNILVIHVYKVTPKLHIPLNILLINLAVADIITGLLALPMWILFFLQPVDVYPDNYPCLIYSFFATFAQIPFAVSFFTIVLICIVRCLMVVYPIQSRNLWINGFRMKLCSILIWIYTSILFTLDFMYRTNWFRKVSTSLLDNSQIITIIQIVHNLIGTLLIAIMYIILVVSIRRNNKLMKSLISNPDATFKFETREMTMVLAVVSLFYICWAPSLAYNFSQPSTRIEDDDERSNNKAIFLNGAFFITGVNSVVNPFIYAGFNMVFRAKFVEIFTNSICPKSVSHTSEMSSCETASSHISPSHVESTFHEESLCLDSSNDKTSKEPTVL